MESAGRHAAPRASDAGRAEVRRVEVWALAARTGGAVIDGSRDTLAWRRRDIVERIREESTLVRAARDAGAGLTILKWRQARLTDALIDLQRLEEEKP